MRAFPTRSEIGDRCEFECVCGWESDTIAGLDCPKCGLAVLNDDDERIANKAAGPVVPVRSGQAQAFDARSKLAA